jgi:hypothetical protein
MRISCSSPLVMVVVWTVSVLSAASGAAQGPPTPDQMVATLKQNLEESQKRLRQYEWVETTVISLKGEEKARKQQRAYYGADGTLTKTPIGDPSSVAAPTGRGGRGGRVKAKVVENKKDEMQDYMERAVKLIHQYVPPNPAQVQKAKDAGKMVVRPPQQGKVRVEFPDFVQPSDLLAIDVDAAAARLGALSVATYLEKREDAVTLDVQFGTLADGTSYAAATTLDAKAKNIRVVITNSGHHPLAR